LTHFVTLLVLEAHFAVALRRFKPPTPVSAATSWNRRGPRSWQDSRLSDRITVCRAAAIPCPIKFLQDLSIDGFLQVGDEEAIACARRLAAEEGIFAGFSSGANLAAALQLLRGAHAGQTVVTLACDSGLKYLSTDLWP
jgi:cysteine synthase